jgi:hypothetical protein
MTKLTHLIQRVWKDPVWSKVIAVGILAGLAKLASAF